MALDYQHSIAHAKRWGGVPEDYLHIDEFLDSSRQFFNGPAHRAMYHHTAGVFLCEQLFGKFVELTGGGKVATRYVATHHIEHDFNGYVPAPSDWLEHLSVPKDLTSRGRAEPAKYVAPMSHIIAAIDGVEPGDATG